MEGDAILYVPDGAAIGDNNPYMLTIEGTSNSLVSASAEVIIYVMPALVDSNHNGLIDINTLDDLHRIRHNLEGTSYKISADDPGDTSGCPVGGCFGYELMRDLDFNESSHYFTQAINNDWTSGSGWNPISSPTSPFSAVLNGNGHTITGLHSLGGESGSQRIIQHHRRGRPY